jgi:hypothetical protein
MESIQPLYRKKIKIKANFLKLLSFKIFSYSLTHSLIELSPSRETANCAAPQKLPSILWNPKVHYHVHKSPPLVSILSQINPVHTIPSYLSEIHFNIVHPPMSLSSGVPTNILSAFLFGTFVLHVLPISSSLT